MKSIFGRKAIFAFGLLAVFEACSYDAPTVGQTPEATGGNGGMSAVSSSSGVGAGETSSSSSGGQTSSSSTSSSSGNGATSSSSSGDPNAGTGIVPCDGAPCTVSPGVKGCCIIDTNTLQCMSKADCMLHPMVDCDGREDCGGNYCCFYNGTTVCTAGCPGGGTILCNDATDCPSPMKCAPGSIPGISHCQ